MKQYLFFLGKHAALSAAEIWRVLDMEGYSPVLTLSTNEVLGVSVEKDLNAGTFNRLGGCDRVAEVAGVQDELWIAEDVVRKIFPDLQPGERLMLGVSTVGADRNYGRKLARDIKKLIRESGGRLKFVEPKSGSRLNAAQVIFNDLLAKPNRELSVITHAGKHYLAWTIYVQDIQSYEKRDTARPARDVKVGMLPPKLAQMMINCGVSHSASRSDNSPVTVFDPFCGMGTVLQEAWLMGYQAIGSDESKEMINATSHNIMWLKGKFTLNEALSPRFFNHDIRKPLPPEMANAADAVVTEPYLGRPLSSPLPPRELDAEIEKLGKLYLAAFENLKRVLKPGGSVLFLMPAWRAQRRSDSFYLMPDPLLDAISALGYIRGYVLPEELSGKWQRAAHRGEPPIGASLALRSGPRPEGRDDRSSAIYARPDALVGRELTLWNLAK